MKQSAVSYIERNDGRLLCVWNRRYGGWSFPGGLVEEGEEVEAAQARELREETSLATVSREPLFSGAHNLAVQSGRASHVNVFRVTPRGQPREVEPGCPVTWLTREEFLKWSPFADFYAFVFDRFPEPVPTFTEVLDDDLIWLTSEQLQDEVKRLRAGIREHRDNTGHQLCWFVPELWNLLPEKVTPKPEIPPTSEFLARCSAYRASLKSE
jgi:ADP-ribose pyrophosphatase YjhB (NUDIX family)